MNTHIYLIRHPAVAVPTSVCYGHTDVALAAPAEETGARLRPHLPADFTLVSSPLSRCLLLAQTLGNPRTDARLMETNFGSWEMSPYDSIERSLIDAWAADPLGFRAHGGESIAQMAARAIAALEGALAEAPGTLVLVSHAGPLRALAGHLLRLPPTEWMQLDIGYGSLHHIGLTDGGDARFL